MYTDGRNIIDGPAPRFTNPTKPADLFTTEYLNSKKAQANPFKPGTQQYEDFQKSQTKDMIDKAGAPNIPAFEGTRNADGTIKSAYQLNPNNINFKSILPQVSNQINGVNVDQTGLDAIKSRALGTGPSPWLNLQLEQQKNDELNNIENTKDQAAGNVAGANSSLAMRGGLSSGARERVAKAGASGALAATQGVRRGGVTDRLNLGIADENTKTDLLKTLPAADLANANFDLGKQQYLGNMAQTQNQADIDAQKYNADATTAANKYNIGNSLSDILQQRAYDSNNYTEAMKAWAAGKTADAQSGGGKK